MSNLFFYYSAMNAGKTTMLLQSSYNYQERGMQTLLFTPDFDNRSEIGVIASRIGLKIKAFPFSRDFNFYEYVRQRLEKPNHNIRCILIDEAHFLTKAQVKQLTHICDDLKLPVLCYGLRSDFQGEPFEGSKYLLILAEKLVELKTICFCGRKATMNLRVDKNGLPIREGAQVEIGGNDSYIAMCRRHFNHAIEGNLAEIDPIQIKEVVA